MKAPRSFGIEDFEKLQHDFLSLPARELVPLLKNVKTGDKVLLNSGIFGIVSNVKDKTLMVKIADNVKVEVVKSAVGSVVQKSA